MRFPDKIVLSSIFLPYTSFDQRETCSMRLLRVAIFGCGMISGFHLRAWKRIPEVNVVALGNRTLSRAEARRDEFVPGARVYNKLGDLLASEQLDFIDILTPPAQHKQHCLQALAAGVHVICQKPIAETLDDARALAEAAARSDCHVAIHENHRYRPWFQDAVKRNQAGFFGTIQYARFEQFDASEPAETYKLESKSGILLEYGSHLIDMMFALFGAPNVISGTASRLNPRVVGKSLVHLTFECSGATVCMDMAWKPAGLSQGGVLIVGSEGEAIYEGTMTRGKSSRFRVVHGNSIVVDQRRSPTDDYVKSFFLFQRQLVDALLGRCPPPQLVTENLKVLESTFDAYEAIERDGGWSHE